MTIEKVKSTFQATDLNEDPKKTQLDADGLIDDRDSDSDFVEGQDEQAPVLVCDEEENYIGDAEESEEEVMGPAASDDDLKSEDLDGISIAQS